MSKRPVRMKTRLAGPEGTAEPGKVIGLSEELAAALVESGQAEYATPAERTDARMQAPQIERTEPENIDAGAEAEESEQADTDRTEDETAENEPERETAAKRTGRTGGRTRRKAPAKD